MTEPASKKDIESAETSDRLIKKNIFATLYCALFMLISCAGFCLVVFTSLMIFSRNVGDRHYSGFVGDSLAIDLLAYYAVFYFIIGIIALALADASSVKAKTVEKAFKAKLMAIAFCLAAMWIVV